MSYAVFFGGSFDPFHNGHIHMLTHVVEYLSVSDIYIVPNYQNPQKKQSLFTAENRLSMLKRLKPHFPQNKQKTIHYHVCDFEIKQKKSCYTYETIHAFKLHYNHEKWILLIGSDQFFSFHTWEKWVDVLDDVELCVVRRDDTALLEYKNYFSQTLLRDKSYSYMILTPNKVDVSSTELRQLLSEDTINTTIMLPSALDSIVHTYKDSVS